MKTKLNVLFAFAIASAINFSSCKKESTSTTPTPPAPTMITSTIRISLVDVYGTKSIFTPKIYGVKVSSAGVDGDTVFKHTITNWAVLTAFPQTDSDCQNVYKSFPMASMGRKRRMS